jgi:hypothetical protein
VATTVTVVDAGNSPALGVIVTVRLSVDTEGGKLILTPFANSPMVFALIVLAFNDSENLSTTWAFSPIPVAPSAGVTITTVGGVVFVAVVVVNELEKVLLRVFPARSFTTGEYTAR